MSGIRYLHGLLLCILILLWGSCASSTRGRLIEKSTLPELSEREVRAEVNAHLLRYSSVVEFTAYGLQQVLVEKEARLAVLYWQLNGISACRGAAFLDDPLVAALDCYVFGLQELGFYRSDTAKKLFGDAQPLVVERLEGVHLPFQALVRTWSPKPGLIRERVEAFAKEHPMTNLSYGRESYAPVMAKIVGDPNLSAFAAVGTLDERIQDIAERLNVYAQQIPKQLRWTTDLITEEMNQSEEINTLVRDLHEINASLARLSTLEDRLPTMIDEQVGVGVENLSSELEPVMEKLDTEREKILASVTKEREATLAEVDRQRLDTLAFVTSERKVMEKVLDEKVVTLNQIVDSEIAVLSTMIDKHTNQLTVEVKATTAQTLRQADEVAQARITQLAWSLLLVGGGLIFLFFLFRFLSMRYLS